MTRNWRAVRRREYNSPRYKANRMVKLRTRPKCERCEAQGYIVPANQVHHTVSIREWYTQGLPARGCSALDNLESICPSCHEIETAKEREAWLKEHPPPTNKRTYPSFDARGRRVV